MLYARPRRKRRNSTLICHETNYLWKEVLYISLLISDLRLLNFFRSGSGRSFLNTFDNAINFAPRL